MSFRKIVTSKIHDKVKCSGCDSKFYLDDGYEDADGNIYCLGCVEDSGDEVIDQEEWDRLFDIYD